MTPAPPTDDELQKVLVAVRVRPGVQVEAIAAASLLSSHTVDAALVALKEQCYVEPAETLGRTHWFPLDYCCLCGCTENHACEGGCSWSEAPGYEVTFGEYAGCCDRCV